MECQPAVLVHNILIRRRNSKHRGSVFDDGSAGEDYALAKGFNGGELLLGVGQDAEIGGNTATISGIT